MTQIISRQYPRLSKGHKKVAAFVLDQPHRAAFMTLRQLAQASGVSRSTAERFAQALGYDGYPPVRAALASQLQETLMPVAKVRVRSARRVTAGLVLAEDLFNLEQTRQTVSDEQLGRVVDLVRRADRVVTLGLGASSFLAGFLAYRLSALRPGVWHLGEGSGSMYRHLHWLGASDLLIALSFPRYSRLMVEACRYARKRGARIVSVTDRVTSPLYGLGDESLVVRSDRSVLASSLTSALSVVDAIAVAVASRERRQALEAISDVTDQLIEVEDYYERQDGAHEALGEGESPLIPDASRDSVADRQGGPEDDPGHFGPEQRSRR